ncbi:DUF5777 family beta-barrel protein [Muricauda sp. MAR_2010_75]|uniref:DUF5777 family beta-barrel protein n=1 Tax=Allomuricauda sp. MAR_2010_75 TaxID=1250232 RepID=UPI00055E58FD|nr:DUF5777 family beta-barrel protein [Muricauda sp. MAR_2010_75]
MKKIIFALLLAPLWVAAQDDLLDEIDTLSVQDDYEIAAFKGLKIVNFETTKMVPKRRLYFVVSHRFGSIKPGIEEFFGLDQAVTRLNFIYGITDGINLGISRSSFEKTYESSLKLRLVRQSQNGSPFSIVSFNTILLNGALEKENLPGLTFEHRLSYAMQILISRKMTPKLSLEAIPTFFHDNLVSLDEQDNSQYAIGLGGRYKISNRVSLNADYGVHLNRASNSPFKNPLSVGVDIETGGHVFQLHFTNAQPMNINTFLNQATGDWGKADIYFGFNLLRIF